jgi:DNA-binding NarL/FixJ family response regulator
MPAAASESCLVVLADGSPVVESGLLAFFRNTRFQLVERVDTLSELHRSLACQDIHVVLGELELSDASLDDLIACCKQQRIPLVLFSSSAHPAWLGRAWRGGVAGWVNKTATCADLLKCLETAAAGDPFWSRKQTRQIIGSLVAKELADKREFPLTDRELEVLRLLASGHSNQRIADRLNIGFETVKEHVQRALAKLGVKDRTQAAVMAERNGVL